MDPGCTGAAIAISMTVGTAEVASDSKRCDPVARPNRTADAAAIAPMLAEIILLASSESPPETKPRDERMRQHAVAHERPSTPATVRSLDQDRCMTRPRSCQLRANILPRIWSLRPAAIRQMAAACRDARSRPGVRRDSRRSTVENARRPDVFRDACPPGLPVMADLFVYRVHIGCYLRLSQRPA